MRRLGLFFCLLLINGGDAAAEYKWSQVGTLEGLRCGNYCDVTVHKGRLVTADSSNGSAASGDFWTSHSASLEGKFSVPRIAIARGTMAGFMDIYGQPANYARTIGIASDGNRLHALLHVGATYGSPKGYYYMPAYAVSEDNGRTWFYHGPVSVEGQSARRIFSSSKAYVVRNGVHYMVQGSRAYGFGALVAFKSTNGRDWHKIGDDISVFEGDRPVFPDMVYHNGRFHLTYENGWRRGGYEIRHLSSSDMLNWRVESKIIAPKHYKGVNIFTFQGELYGHVFGRVWVARDVNDNRPLPRIRRNTGNSKLPTGPVKRIPPGSDTDTSEPIVPQPVVPQPVLPQPVENDPADEETDATKPVIDQPAQPAPDTPVSDGLAPKVVVAGTKVTVTWAGDPAVRYAIKLVGPKNDFSAADGMSHTYSGLPVGRYKVRVRPKGGDYSDAYFTIAAGQTTTPTPSPKSGGRLPKGNVVRK